MGNSSSNIQRSRRTSSSSSFRKSSDDPEISRKIDEKECVFIAMQSEIDKAITEDNREAMNSLLSEIAAHIMDLNQLKQIKLNSTNRGRTQKIIYNFELSLAKLKSICNYDTAMKKERDRRNLIPNSSFYVNPIDSVEPDIVSDLIRFDNTNSIPRSSYRENRNTLPNLPENDAGKYHRQLSRNNSLYCNQPQSYEEAFVTIENEFEVQAQRPVENVDEYYQMDKGVFYLYVKLKNLELPESLALNERKVKLIKELTEFRTSLDKMSGELEEQNEINQEINTLEVLLDSASQLEIATLKVRAMELKERVEMSSWNPHLAEGKVEILRRLARYLERVAYTSPSSSVENSGEHLYGNLNSLQEQMKNVKANEETKTIYSNIEYPSTNNDNSLDNESDHSDDNFENDEESVYGNIEIIKHNIESQISKNLQRSGSSASQRGTLYVNADVVRQNDTYEIHVLSSEDGKMQREVINKRPLPLPRNYDDKIINDLPKHWQRLNEIFNQGTFSDTDKSEVADIQRHAEVAKNLFERKIKRIMEKSEDSVEL